MYDIVSVGSATVDVFITSSKRQTGIAAHAEHYDVCYHIGGKILVDDLHFDTGGGGTNTATAFARLGLKTGYLGKVGADMHGRTVLEALKREGIDFLGKADPRGQTGYSVILAGLMNDRAILAYKGINDAFRPRDVPAKALRTKGIYFSSMMGQSWKTLMALARMARAKRIPYAFNPSMYLAQKGLMSLRPLIRGASLVIMNIEEARALMRSKRTGVRRLLAGISREMRSEKRVVIITDGPRGAYAYDGLLMYAVPARKIKVMETTGAGDAFAAGVFAGMLQQQSLLASLRLGMAEAENVLGSIGAKTGLLTKREAARIPRYKIIKEAL